ncbi:hypothetical protein WICPIJ_003003 [Wickerhamomyces pijperi]|uniref:Uncharacterized protein n=1 Tax=Wickerhamomyces pijperi TaxID=599730 RepID=A0A9P8QAQ7_WICPI|nr:hypothetical protein WICPIJ_003003 [Wickerhamomyces pijperi]
MCTDSCLDSKTCAMILVIASNLLDSMTICLGFSVLMISSLSWYAFGDGASAGDGGCSGSLPPLPSASASASGSRSSSSSGNSTLVSKGLMMERFKRS